MNRIPLSELEGQHFPSGNGEDFYVEPQGEPVDVFEVGGDAVLHVGEVGCGSAETFDLRVACQAGPHVVPTHVVVDKRGVVIGVRYHVRPWADD